MDLTSTNFHHLGSPFEFAGFQPTEPNGVTAGETPAIFLLRGLQKQYYRPARPEKEYVKNVKLIVHSTC